MTNQSSRSHRTPSRGFTLIELVLVLIILAILATAALNTVEVQVDQTRFEGTQQTIQRFESAVYVEKTNATGVTTSSGFFVDLGGLPRAFGEEDSTGRDILTARELWANPNNLAIYDFRFATDDVTILPNGVANTDNNLDGNTDGNDDDRDGDPVNPDREVRIGTGWRGPYLQLSPGATAIGQAGLTDSWGNALVSYVDPVVVPADPNIVSPYQHLRGLADADVTGVGQAIYGVRGLGRDDNRDDVPPGNAGGAYDRDLPGIGAPMGLSESNLFQNVPVTVEVPEGLDGDAGAVVESNANIQQLIVQIYYPDTATGLVRIDRAKLVTGSGIHDAGAAVDRFDFIFEEGAGPVTEIRFPIGARAIRAYRDTNSDPGDFSDGTTDPIKSQILYQLIPAGSTPQSVTLSIN